MLYHFLLLLSVVRIGGLVRTFQILGTPFIRKAAGDVAHTSANLYGIGSDDFACFGAAVAQHYFIAVVLACVEAERAQIDPGTSTHLLIHFELGTTALVVDGIESLVCTVGQCLIGYIDGILTALRNIGYPFSGTFLSFLDGFGHAIGTFLERIGEVGV